jgi:hypothetical protein
MDRCKTCGKELVHEKGKRKKEYCGNTCRSSYWVKVNKKPKVKTIPIEEWNEIQKKLAGIGKEIKITDANKQPQIVENISEENPKTNYVINTEKKLSLSEQLDLMINTKNK